MYILKYIILCSSAVVFCFATLFFFERERVCVHTSRGEGQKERERENLKQAPSPAWSQPGTQLGAKSHHPEIMT